MDSDTPSLWKRAGNNQRVALRSPAQITKAIAGGADPNADRGTPLMFAVDEGTGDQVKALLDGGANVKLEDDRGEEYTFDRSLWFIRKAVQGRDGADKLQHLAAAGLDITLITRDGCNGLHLLKENPDDFRSTPHGYAFHPSLENSVIAHRLMDAGASAASPNEFGATPLQAMAGAGVDDTVIERAIRAGANVNAQDEIGRTALHFAKAPFVAECLLTHGADPTLADSRGNTADNAAGAWMARETIQRAQVRYRLGQVAQSVRPQDSTLASVEEVLARRSHGRRM